MKSQIIVVILRYAEILTDFYYIKKISQSINREKVG